MGTTDLLLKSLEKNRGRLHASVSQTDNCAGRGLRTAVGRSRDRPAVLLCEKPIQPDEIEFEVESIEVAVRTLRFHRVCHYAWQLECDRVKRRPPRGIPKNPAPQLPLDGPERQ